MESSSSVSDKTTPDELNPTAGKGKPSGKGAKKRKATRFRSNKNKDFQTELTASLLRRLNVTDPTNVTAIQLQSSIVPAVVPVSFRGLPRFVKSLWARMKAIGTRPFTSLATDENLAIFYKCVAVICDAKLTFAQKKCQVKTPEPLTFKGSYTDVQLRVIQALAARLPYPLAIYIEAIGNLYLVVKALLCECEYEQITCKHI